MKKTVLFIHGAGQGAYEEDGLLAALDGEVILVGHSLGGSILLKYLSEERVEKPISGTTNSYRSPTLGFMQPNSARQPFERLMGVGISFESVVSS